MLDLPTLETRRLWLRPLAPHDTEAIQAAASAKAVADTMISLPHPYPPGEAGRYVARQRSQLQHGRGGAFAVELKTDAHFRGLVEIREIDREHSQAELSFWLAVEAWGQGLMTEAVRTVTRYGLEEFGLNRLYAYHMLRNPASGRVLEKAGFRKEGLLRQRVRKWGRFEDVALWAILRQDWQEATSEELQF